MIGIVILNFENWLDTKRCIESIRENPPQEAYRIILVDNASVGQPPYDLADFVEEHSVLLIRNKQNLGYNAGNNVGIVRAQEIHCEFILISNNDVQFTPGSIQRLCDDLKKDPGTGIAGPKIVGPKGQVQSCNLCRKTGMKEKYLVRTRASVIFRKSRRTYFGLDRDEKSSFFVYAVLGCCFMMSAACAKKITPLDEYPFLYEEELMLGIRMEQAGFRTVYDPKAVVMHIHGASTNRQRAFSFAHNVRSEIYYCRAYLEAEKWQICPLYAYRVLLYLIRCMKYRDFRRNWRYFISLTKHELSKANSHKGTSSGHLERNTGR